MKKKLNLKSISMALGLFFWATTVSISTAAVIEFLGDGRLTSPEQSEVNNISLMGSEYISINGGETKLISFPREIKDISFNKESGFSIRTLVGGQWIDMSNNPADYEIMQGYIIRNFSSDLLTISVDYNSVISTDQTLFQKQLSAGWNLYAPAVKNDYCKAVKASEALNGTAYSQLIDFSTLALKKLYSSEVALDYVYSGETLIVNKSIGNHTTFRDDGNYIIKSNIEVENDYLYEGGAYGVFVNNDTLVSGNQNITDIYGNELIKNNNHAVVSFDSSLTSDLNITDTNEVELMNFNLTSKYHGTDIDGTSSILATLAFNTTMADKLTNMKVFINGAQISTEITVDMNNAIIIKLLNPVDILRGDSVNIVLKGSALSGAMTNGENNPYIKFDRLNTLLLDSVNLLPYCGDLGYIIGTSGYDTRVVNINIIETENLGYSQMQLDAANNLANQGYIIDHSDNGSLYMLGNTVMRQEMAVIFRGIAGLEAKGVCDDLFTDISTQWACFSIEALAEAELIPTGGSFMPEEFISKVDAVELTLKSVGSSYIYDSTKSQTSQEQVVSYAVSAGIISNFTDYETAASRGWIYGVLVEAQTYMSNSNDESDLLGDLLGDLNEPEIEITTSISNIPLGNQTVIKGAVDVTAMNFIINSTGSIDSMFIKEIQIQTMANSIAATSNEIVAVKLISESGELLASASGSSLLNGVATFSGLTGEHSGNVGAYFSIELDIVNNDTVINNSPISVYFVGATITDVNNTVISFADGELDIPVASGKDIIVINNGEITTTYDQNNQANQDDKNILAGNSAMVFSVDIQATNEDVNVGSVVFTTSADLRNVINNASLYLNETLIATNSILDITENTITFDNVSNLIINENNSELQLQLNTNNIGYQLVGEAIAGANITNITLSNMNGVNSGNAITENNLAVNSKYFSSTPALATTDITYPFNGGVIMDFNILVDSGNNTDPNSGAEQAINVSSITFVNQGNLAAGEYQLQSTNGNTIATGVSEGSDVKFSGLNVSFSDIFSWRVVATISDIEVDMPGLDIKADGIEYAPIY